MAVTAKQAADVRTAVRAYGTWGNRQSELFEISFGVGSTDDATSTYDSGILRAGTLVLDAIIWIDDGAVATSTLDVGLKSVSGTNQDDADYFFVSLDAVTLAQTRKVANNPPLLLAQDMYLRSTIKVANQNAAFHAYILVDYIFRGNA